MRGIIMKKAFIVLVLGLMFSIAHAESTVVILDGWTWWVALEESMIEILD